MELPLKEKTLIMGILNVTPDSFYDGGRFYDREKAIERAFQIIREGADIIDIGGESSRPGSEPISVEKEIERVCPIIEKVSSESSIPISIDTYKSQVAEEAIKAGASMVNDISALSFDENIAAVVSRHNTYLVLMHMKGTPKTMQNDPHYNNLLEEIYASLQNAAERALDNNIPRGRIIIDPGIGFGKTLLDNYTLINNLDFLKKMGFPLMIGLSMKSLIGKLYTEDSDRLPATLALNAIAVIRGADIIRVHDVRSHRLALTAIEKLQEAEHH